MPVAATAPGLFTLSANGIGPALAVNVDGSINGPSHPANSGSYIIVYATGAGQTNPPGSDGLPGSSGVPAPLPNATVTATIGGKPATVSYAGGAANAGGRPDPGEHRGARRAPGGRGSHSAPDRQCAHTVRSHHCGFGHLTPRRGRVPFPARGDNVAMTLSEAKLKRMKALADGRGIIAAAAMDQRGSLQKSLAAARGVDKKEITPDMMGEFKTGRHAKC